jgi:hypothetical protein
MSVCTYLFKPRFDISLAAKPLNCFLSDFLMWEDNSVNWNIKPVKGKDGWYMLDAYQDAGSSEGYSEACWHKETVTSEQLTEDMMVLIVESGICNEYEDDDGKYYTMEDVELCNILAILSEEDSYVYSPYGDKVFIHHVGTKRSEHRTILDWILDQTIDEVEEGKKVSNG